MRVPDPESNPITNARTTKYRLTMASYPHLTHVIVPASASSEKHCLARSTGARGYPKTNPQQVKQPGTAISGTTKAMSLPLPPEPDLRLGNHRSICDRSVLSQPKLV